jgi:hypothetical protein
MKERTIGRWLAWMKWLSPLLPMLLSLAVIAVIAGAATAILSHETPDEPDRDMRVVLLNGCCDTLTAAQRQRLTRELEAGAWKDADWSRETTFSPDSRQLWGTLSPDEELAVMISVAQSPDYDEIRVVGTGDSPAHARSAAAQLDVAQEHTTFPYGTVEGCRYGIGAAALKRLIDGLENAGRPHDRLPLRPSKPDYRPGAVWPAIEQFDGHYVVSVGAHDRKRRLLAVEPTRRAAVEAASKCHAAYIPADDPSEPAPAQSLITFAPGCCDAATPTVRKRIERVIKTGAWMRTPQLIEVDYDENTSIESVQLPPERDLAGVAVELRVHERDQKFEHFDVVGVASDAAEAAGIGEAVELGARRDAIAYTTVDDCRYPGGAIPERVIDTFEGVGRTRVPVPALNPGPGWDRTTTVERVGGTYVVSVGEHHEPQVVLSLARTRAQALADAKDCLPSYGKWWKQRRSWH